MSIRHLSYFHVTATFFKVIFTNVSHFLHVYFLCSKIRQSCAQRCWIIQSFSNTWSIFKYHSGDRIDSELIKPIFYFSCPHHIFFFSILGFGYGRLNLGEKPKEENWAHIENYCFPNEKMKANNSPFKRSRWDSNP